MSKSGIRSQKAEGLALRSDIDSARAQNDWLGADGLDTKNVSA